MRSQIAENTSGAAPTASSAGAAIAAATPAAIPAGTRPGARRCAEALERPARRAGGRASKRQGRELFEDPWAARDAYIEVVLDRSTANVDAFLARAPEGRADLERRRAALELLEMQRQAMLMFTSCAWFFDDIGGIETIQALHARRPCHPARRDALRPRDKPAFEEALTAAKSNAPERGDGAQVFRRAMESARIDLRRVAAHYAITSLFGADATLTDGIGPFDVHPFTREAIEAGHSKLVIGEAEIASQITEERDRFAYAAIHLGDQNIIGGVQASNGDPYESIIQAARDSFRSGDLASAIAAIGEHFAGPTFSLRSLFKDEQRAIIARILDPMLDEAEGAYRQIYDEHMSMIRFLASTEYPVPNRLQAATDFALNLSMRHALMTDEIDLCARAFHPGRSRPRSR